MTASQLLKSSRRQLFSHAGLLSAIALPWPAPAQTSSGETPSSPGPKSTQPPRGTLGSEPLDFTAYRNGDRLGFHRIDFAEEGKRLIVDIEIVFEVKFAFIPLYGYRHRNREIWEGGRLVSMSTETDDNGTDYKVEVTRNGDRLVVDGVDGRLDLPGDTLTTSYWNEAAMTKGAWLDTQRGQLVRSEVTKKPMETVRVKGNDVEATPYDLAGDITCSLWYRDGRWVKLRFLGEDGSEIDYTLERFGQSGFGQSG